jgi:hypothetical protein
VEVVFVRFGPAAPAVGVSRRDNHNREQRTMTYSHEGTPTLLLPHTNMPNYPARTDVPTGKVERHSTAVVAAGDMEQTHTMS